MISGRTIIQGTTGPILQTYLEAEDRSGPLFRYLKGRCHGNRFCEKMANSPLSSRYHSETEWNIAISVCALTAQMKAVHRAKIA